MVGQELHGNDGQNALKTVHGVRNFQKVAWTEGLRFCVARFANQNWAPLPSNHLLKCIHTFGVDGVSSHNHDDRHLTIQFISLSHVMLD